MAAVLLARAGRTAGGAGRELRPREVFGAAVYLVQRGAAAERTGTMMSTLVYGFRYLVALMDELYAGRCARSVGRPRQWV